MKNYESKTTFLNHLNKYYFFIDMLIYFRVDSGVDIGMGHLVRCISLANVFQLNGHEVHFICQDLKGNQINKINFCVHVLSNINVLAFLKENRCDMLVIDNYEIDQKFESLWKPYVKKIMVIDDLYNRKHDCDYLIDSCEHNEYKYLDLVPPRTRLLNGPLYLILNYKYQTIIENERIKNYGLKRIHISFGGSDKNNTTGKIIKLLMKKKHQIEKFNEIQFDVVIGGANPNYNSVKELISDFTNFKIHYNINGDEMIKLLKKTDLAIGATGVSVWERLFMGVPSIIKNIASNQNDNLEYLNKKGLIHVPDDDNDLIDLINMYVESSYTLFLMSAKCSSFIDGLGCQRIVDYVSK